MVSRIIMSETESAPDTSSRDSSPSRSTRKHYLGENGEHEIDTPTRKRVKSREADEASMATADMDIDMGAMDLSGNTPTPRKRGRPKKNSINDDSPTPKAKRFASFETPTKRRLMMDVEFTPGRKAGADRSARRKSAKALIERVVGDGDTDAEEVEDDLVREIYGSSGEEAEETNAEDPNQGLASGVASQAVPDTPSKTPQRKARRRAKSPTPPRDLPPHEMYLAQNKPGRPKTSENNLSSISLLTHDEYFSILSQQRKGQHHRAEIEFLEALHADSFPQWIFELLQGFGICLYGFGSKRKLLLRLASELYSRSHQQKIVVVNGYAPATSMRDILNTVAAAIDPAHKIPTAQPAAMVQSLLSHLSTTEITITIIVHSIDAPPLRKQAHQSLLSQLSAHPQIHFICSVDTPDFPLLWDMSLRSAFNFVFHDCTTYAPFSVELDVVDVVHELLGRKARRVNGKEGVAFVLRSLPENARNLFQLLVGEVLMAAEEEGGEAEDAGVEYRMLYNKAVEEFICSSEMAFRTLLKEFHDHQIITSRKDAIGTELLSLPFNKAELEAILEDLMG